MTQSDTTTDPTSVTFALYPEVEAMFNEFPKFREEILPSKYWEELNRKNLQQLADNKYDNFKRTLARNYFTWIVNPLNKQIRFLMREAGIWRSIAIVVRAVSAPRHDLMKRRHTIDFRSPPNARAIPPVDRH